MPSTPSCANGNYWGSCDRLFSLLGAQEPVPSWGLMLRGGAHEYAESAPWVAVFPGLAITLAVFAFNLFGDALRDELDPKFKT